MALFLIIVRNNAGSQNEYKIHETSTNIKQKNK